MFSKWIKNIRSKPESVKRTVTLVSSLSITAVCVFFWFISYINFSDKILNTKSEHDPMDFVRQMSAEISESYGKAKENFHFDTLFSGNSNTMATMASDTASSSVDVVNRENLDTTDIPPPNSEPVVKSTSTKNNTSDSASLDDILNVRK